MERWRILVLWAVSSTLHTVKINELTFSNAASHRCLFVEREEKGGAQNKQRIPPPSLHLSFRHNCGTPAILDSTMDFNNAPPADQAPTSAPVILARNIQKFFKSRSEGAQSKDQHSDLDVNTVLNDVDSILDGRSVEDGRLLLRGMVADLLREVDLLRWRLDETSANLQRVKEERDVVNNDYRDRLLSLMLALQNAVGENSNDGGGAAAPIQQRSLLQNGQLLTADEATTLTIRTLTNKIETLNLEASQTQQDLAAARERIEDLESENTTKTHKIAALEKQFLSINKKRNKVVNHKQQQQQLSDKTNDTSNHRNAANAANSHNKPAAAAVPINAQWNRSSSPSSNNNHKPAVVPINALWNSGLSNNKTKPSVNNKKPVVAIDARWNSGSSSNNNNTAPVDHTSSSSPNHSSVSSIQPKQRSANASMNSGSVSSKPKRKGARLVKLVD